MNTLLIALTIIFGVFGIIVVILEYIPIIMQNKNNQKCKTKISIVDTLAEMKEETDYNKAANLFVELMQSSYVLVHTIVNKGNSYDDEIQCRVFCELMTNEVVDKLKSLEESDGKCTF